VPLVWCVIEHPSVAVADEEYQGVLEKAATLVPFACTMVLLADRGFADTELMHHLKRLGWHFRIRIKSNFWIYRPGHGGFQVRAISLVLGANEVLAWRLAHHQALWACASRRGVAFGKGRGVVCDQ